MHRTRRIGVGTIAAGLLGGVVTLAVAFGVLLEPTNPASAATITFRSARSAGASSGTLTITKPTGTIAGDVMIASISVRPNTATITAPSGWTLVRRVNNSNSTANSLAIYDKVAGGSEPASYSWTFSTSTGAAGGIQTFSGVDTVNPIDVEAGQTTTSGTTHTAPSVTTTVANTMLVTSHAVLELRFVDAALRDDGGVRCGQRGRSERRRRIDRRELCRSGSDRGDRHQVRRRNCHRRRRKRAYARAPTGGISDEHADAHEHPNEYAQ